MATPYCLGIVCLLGLLSTVAAEVAPPQFEVIARYKVGDEPMLLGEGRDGNLIAIQTGPRGLRRFERIALNGMRKRLRAARNGELGGIGAGRLVPDEHGGFFGADLVGYIVVDADGAMHRKAILSAEEEDLSTSEIVLGPDSAFYGFTEAQGGATRRFVRIADRDGSVETLCEFAPAGTIGALNARNRVASLVRSPFGGFLALRSEVIAVPGERERVGFRRLQLNTAGAIAEGQLVEDRILFELLPLDDGRVLTLAYQVEGTVARSSLSVFDSAGAVGPLVSFPDQPFDSTGHTPSLVGILPGSQLCLVSFASPEFDRVPTQFFVADTAGSLSELPFTDSGRALSMRQAPIIAFDGNAYGIAYRYANFHPKEALLYRFRDPQATPANRPPIARHDFVPLPPLVAAPDGAGSTVTTVQPLLNDADADEDPLVIAGVTTLSGAQASIEADGKTLSIEFADGVSVETELEYEVSDGRGGTAHARVSLREARDGGAFIGLLSSNTPGDVYYTARLTLRVSRLGPVTGTLLYLGERHSIRGEFDTAGELEIPIQTIVTAAAASLRLTWESDGVHASLLGAGINEIGSALRVPAQAEASLVGRYTAALTAASENLPTGTGWSAVRILKSGSAAFIGRLADGSTLSATAWLRANGELDLYATPRRGSTPRAGELVGLVVIESRALVEHASVRWTQREDSHLYDPEAFSGTLSMLIAAYQPSPQLFDNATHGTFSISEGYLPQPLSAPVILDRLSVKTLGADLDVTAAMDSKSGIVSGTFAQDRDHPPTLFTGVVIQSQRRVAGQFTSSKNHVVRGGSFELVPQIVR